MCAKENPETIAVRAGHKPEDHFGAVNPPVYRASTLLHRDLETFRNESAPYSYGRQGMVAHQALEEAVAELEGGHSCVLTASGLAAVTTALLCHLEAGDHLLVSDSVYGPTRTFCDTVLAKLGIDVEYYDPLTGAGIAEHLRETSKVVFAESPGSLTFEIQDIPALARAAHQRGALLMLDNTWSAGYFLRPFELGVDMSIQAATKYIVGHSDVLAGTITSTKALARKTRKMHATLGMRISPDDVYLALRGLRTLPVRLQQHMKNALALARWLEKRPEVSRILHPARPDHPQHALWKRDFTGACGLFAFILKPASEKALAAMFDGFRYFGMGYSWGGHESLMIPADPSRQRSATSWSCEGELIRIHAGLENVDDLVADLQAGFERLNSHA